MSFYLNYYWDYLPSPAFGFLSLGQNIIVTEYNVINNVVMNIADYVHFKVVI